jgi:hypothetical protein
VITHWFVIELLFKLLEVSDEDSRFVFCQGAAAGIAVNRNVSLIANGSGYVKK